MAPDNKDEAVIPILRTYEGDVHHVAQTKGGEELRQILVKEMEEKRKAQEEYRQKMRGMMKESLVLKDRQRSFMRGFRKKKEKDASEAIARDFDRQQIDDTVSGALSYLDPNIKATGDGEGVPAESQGQKTGMFPRIARGSEETEKPSAAPQTAVEDIPRQAVQREDLGAGMVKEMPEVDPTEDLVGVAAQKEPKEGIMSRLRKKKEPQLSGAEREALQQKQDEVVEKESIRKAWKDFSNKKESLRQLGLEARDMRTYDPNTPANPILKKQNVVAVTFVLIVLALMVFVVASVSFTGEEQPIITPPESSSTVPDIIAYDDVMPVNISTSLSDWGSIARKRSRNDVVTKYVPYRADGENRSQTNLSEFLQLFSVTVPRGLRSALGDYYFVGNYTDQDEASGVFIVPVRNYSDALVWMLNWESRVISALTRVFPSLVSEANPANVTVESGVVDNKDIRVLRHTSSPRDVLYYFFDRSTLVFIVGDQSLVARMNERIRQSNTAGL